MVRASAFLVLTWFSTAGDANTSIPESEPERWYTSDQVALGEKLFAIHCAGCHGKNAQGAAFWKTRDKDGNLPPPPLNGTAHTWHHQLPLLRRVISEGGVESGGRMPRFEAKLSPAEIDAVIAWIQSLWSEDIYRQWSGAGTPRITMPDILKDLLPKEQQ